MSKTLVAQIAERIPDPRVRRRFIGEIKGATPAVRRDICREWLAKFPGYPDSLENLEACQVRDPEQCADCPWFLDCVMRPEVEEDKLPPEWPVDLDIPDGSPMVRRVA